MSSYERMLPTMYIGIYESNRIALRINFYLLGILVLTSMVDCESVNSTGALDGLRNVVTLTADNFDSKLAANYHFVLFHSSGYE